MSLEDLLERGRKAREEPAEGEGPDTVTGPAPAARRRSDPTPLAHGPASSSEISHAEELVRQQPDDLQVVEYLAFLYYGARRYPEAIELYRQLLAAEHRRPEQLFHLGNCYARVGDPIRARSHWRQCLSASPGPGLASRVHKRLEEHGEE